MKNIILIVLLSAVFSQTVKQYEGTEAYFLSPHGLGKTPQVSQALEKIQSQIRVKRTTYNKSSITYILDNITIGTAYIDGRQKIEIGSQENVLVSGGRVQFTYRFNYTKSQNNVNTTGSGYGSVFSDSLNYTKTLGISRESGFILWQIPAGEKGFNNLTIKENRMIIKRLQPFNQSDLENIQELLDKAIASIDPSNIEVQILQIFNQIFPLALNESLNHETFGQSINYTYKSNTHGDMKLNIIHQNYGFDINPVDGYQIIFLSKIIGWDQTTCNITVPKKPLSYDLYGGSQNLQLNCFYEDIVLYLQSNGWLDTYLHENWECNAFQFYAGDLFDIINNLYLTFNPRSILDGECVAQKTGLKFYPSREFDTNSYTLEVGYKCNLKGSSKQGITTQVLKFSTNVKIYIKAAAEKTSYSFKIIMVDIVNMAFEPVGDYYVSKVDLAMYKSNQVFKNLVNTQTFGTGFPSVPRVLPKTRIDTDYAFYYDATHFDLPETLDY